MANVLTDEEVRFRVGYESEGFCWLEEKGEQYCTPAVIGPIRHGVTFPDGTGFCDEVNVISLSEQTAVMHTFSVNDYGKFWRCWGTRPTKEERKKTWWDGDVISLNEE